jgi:hypothetical protein
MITKNVLEPTLVVQEKLLIQLRCAIVELPLLLEKILEVSLAEDSS